MQKLLAKIAMVSMLASMVFIAPRAQAVTAPLWDVSGSYVFDFEYGGTYSHDVSLTQDSLGSLTGSGSHPTGGSPVYTWVITSGSVSGNTITFTANYTASADAVTPQTTMVVTGTIAPDGTMSGSWSDNYQGGVRNGTWSTAGTATPISYNLVVVSSNTSAGENQPGWMFNRDTNTDTPYVFNTVLPSIGSGSLYVQPIGATAADKFIAENFINTPITDVNSISYDFAIGVGNDVSDKNHFYMNVYANFGESDDNKFYDCRYSVVPTVGVVNGFTTVTFDPTQSYPVTTRSGAIGTASPHICPSSPAAMDGLSPGSNIRVFSLNVGDTSVNDQGLDGYLDNVIVSLSSGITTYDFEPNHAPVAFGDSIITNESTATSSVLVATDVNMPAQTLVYSVVTGPIHGTISGLNTSTGEYTYTPDVGYFGADSFTFKAYDGEVDSNVATILVTVNSTNSAPVASNNAVTTDEDVPLNITLVATDTDSDPLTYTIVTPPTNGTLSILLGNTVVYTPNVGYFGPDSFTFKASDAEVDSNIATVSITVNPVLTSKDECKNGGWEIFTNLSFKNQGQCVAYTNHLE